VRAFRKNFLNRNKNNKNEGEYKETVVNCRVIREIWNKEKQKEKKVVVGRCGIITGSQLLILIGQILLVCVSFFLWALSMCSELFFFFFFSTSNWGGWWWWWRENFVLIIILFFLDCLTHCNLFSLCSPGGDSDDQNDTHEPLVYITHTHIRSYLLLPSRRGKWMFIWRSSANKKNKRKAPPR
jgi:hypothetical protein